MVLLPLFSRSPVRSALRAPTLRGQNTPRPRATKRDATARSTLRRRSPNGCQFLQQRQRPTLPYTFTLPLLRAILITAE